MCKMSSGKCVKLCNQRNGTACGADTKTSF
nr:MAG TPA: hypothetical protein [Caudoviricetes sp.]